MKARYIQSEGGGGGVRWGEGCECRYVVSPWSWFPFQIGYFENENGHG